jgi:hypothetical protein
MIEQMDVLLSIVLLSSKSELGIMCVVVHAYPFITGLGLDNCMGRFVSQTKKD